MLNGFIYIKTVMIFEGKEDITVRPKDVKGRRTKRTI